jgi:TPR repeat protein
MEDSNYELGNQYYYGINVEKDFKEAIRYYKLSSENRNSNAQLLLGLMYMDGIGGIFDRKEGMKLLLLSLNEGNLLSKTCYYIKNFNRREDPIIIVENQSELDESLLQLTKLSSQGNSSAMNLIGKVYHYDMGITSITLDLFEAFKYYKLAADQGNASAKFNLGICYDKGDGVDIDCNEAFKYYKLAADQGNSSAQFNLGVCYENGDGVDINMNEAFKYYKLAADQGSSSAQFNLGFCFVNGDGVDIDLNEAFKYYKLAAEQGDAPAQYNVGTCYENGDGVDIDLNEAFKYYKLSGDQGLACAQYRVGLYYHHGKGIEIDLREAFSYYILSANQGFQESIEKLASTEILDLFEQLI